MVVGPNGRLATWCVSLLLVTVGCATTAPVREGRKERPGDLGVSVMNAEAVRMRVGNRSEVDFDRVVVKFPSQEEDYGRVRAGAQADYRQIAKAYRYAHIEVTIKGTTVALRPMDYVGEEPLAPGDYTYALSYDPAAGGQLQLALISEGH